MSYAYNGLGDRLRQTVNNQPTTYVLDLNAGLTQVLNDGTNTYLYGPDRIAQVNGANTGYFLGDALGSVRQMTDASGKVTLAEGYDPYGNVATNIGTQTTSYGFTGEQTDSTGLQYLRARYYDPNMGRFGSADTWGGDAYSPISFDKWVYANANPVIYTDPSGKDPVSVTGCLSWLFAPIVIGGGPEDPAGDIAGGGAYVWCLLAAATVVGGTYYYVDVAPQIKERVGTCDITWEYLLQHVATQSKPDREPIKIPWPIWTSNNRGNSVDVFYRGQTYYEALREQQEGFAAVIKRQKDRDVAQGLSTSRNINVATYYAHLNSGDHPGEGGPAIMTITLDHETFQRMELKYGIIDNAPLPGSPPWISGPDVETVFPYNSLLELSVEAQIDVARIH